MKNSGNFGSVFFLVENVFKELFARAAKRAETGETKGLPSPTIYWMPVAGQ